MLLFRKLCFKLTFLNLIYLPATIIVAFTLPFYMLFSFETTHSILKKIVMSSFEIEYEQVFRFRDSQTDVPL